MRKKKHIIDDEERMDRLEADLKLKPNESGIELGKWFKKGEKYQWGYLWECQWDNANRNKQQPKDEIFYDDIILSRIGNSGDYLLESIEELKCIFRKLIHSNVNMNSVHNSGETSKMMNIMVSVWKNAGKVLMSQIGLDVSEWEQQG